MKDKAQRVHQQLCGKEGGGSADVVVGRDLNEVDADDVAALGKALKQFQDFVIEEAAVRGRSGARRDGGVEAVDVDGEVVARAFGDAGKDGIGSKATNVSNRQDVGARFARGGIIGTVGRRDVSDSQLRESGDVFHFGCASQGVSVSVANAVPLVNEIKMRINMNDVNRLLVVESPDAGDVDGVVAAEHDRQGAGGKNLSNADFNVIVAFDGVGVNDVGVADVDDLDLVDRKIDDIVLEVVGAAVSERKQGGGFADGTGAESRAGAILGSHIERRAENGDVRINAFPVKVGGLLSEGAVSDEGKVEASGLVGVFCHGVLLWATV